MESNQSAAVTVAAAEAEKAEAPYVPQRFRLTFDDTPVFFVSEQRIQKVKEGKVVKQIPYDHYGLEAKDLDALLSFAKLVLAEHDKQVEGAGTALVIKLIEKILEGANENIIDPETGEASSQRFGEWLMKPIVKSTTSINSLQDEITATNAKIGEAWTAQECVDQERQLALLSAMGFKEVAQLQGYMETLAHKIETLVRRQSELLVKRQQREAKKAEKLREAAAALAAENAAKAAAATTAATVKVG